MESTIVKAILEHISDTRVAVLGDFYLDIAWELDVPDDDDDADSPQRTPVRRQVYRLGGAAHVAHDLIGMGCGHVHAFGAIGADPWGRELRRQLRGLGIDTRGMVRQTELFHTPARISPSSGDEEYDQLEFGAYNRLTDESAAALIEQLEARLADTDVVLIHQQLQPGIHNRYLRGRLAKLIDRHPDILFLLDSHSGAPKYLRDHAWLILNPHQTMRLASLAPSDEPAPVLVPRAQILKAAGAVVKERGRPVIVSRGDRGIIVDTGRLVADVPGIQVLGRTDDSGTRHAILAAFGLALASGAKPSDAARFANLAAAITRTKLGEPGTVTADELRAAATHPAYTYRPELAEDPRQARQYAGTRIELVDSPPDGFRLTHAIFDHDGTISTLRQGWESIMEPMMVQAILGPHFDDADEGLYHQVLHQVRELIDQTTGMPTLVQMTRLARLVRDVDCVPEADILDPDGYRAIYAESLTRVVTQRLVHLSSGELAPEDFVIKNSIPFLRALRDAGVQIHLIASADQADVEAEVQALGMADLFSHIFGAAREGSREAKRQIVDRVIDHIGVDAIPGLATFGDGPAEMRECRRHGGLAIGVATDEVRRFGLNPVKRSRLIRAGATVILPDYSQYHPLLHLLGLTAQTPTATSE